MSALAYADDNLPPVPKSADKSIAKLTTPSVTPASIPTMAPPPVETTAILRVKIVQEQEDAGGEAASLPLTPKASTPRCKAEAKTEARCEAPLAPPVPSASGLVQNRCCNCACHCTCARYEAKKKAPVVHFLANEFLRKPIYGVEKAMNDADGRRICCETCRLERESERLTAEAARLAEKLKTCPDCVKAKFRLLKEEAEYAKDANRNAVKRAKLECKQADYSEQKQKLEQKHDELFPVRERDRD